MSRERIAILGVGGLGLAVYLWAALSAPVVLWADSEIDLAWARAGLGIFRPVPPPEPGVPVGHLAKPAYLLFLRLASRALPALTEPRSIVVVQSILLWASILFTSLWLTRRRSGVGILFCVVALAYLRARDAASAVMPEALATAVLLPLAALLIDPPQRPRAFVFLGLGAAFLFLVRPNSGGALLVLAIAALGLARRGKSPLLLLAGFAVLAVPLWFLGRSALPGDPLHGLGFQILEGSADYYWAPSLGSWPSTGTPADRARAQLERAAENWKRTLAEPRSDRRRQLLWRGLHGLFGEEFYDSRWSTAYQALSRASRLASPFLILAAIALLLATRRAPDAGYPKELGILLLFLILGQNLLLGSNPRYVLPFLPVLFLFAVRAAAPLLQEGWPRRVALAAVFGGGVALLSGYRGILDWQWGQIESAGVTLRQTIPKGALPVKAPATLHVRVAPPIPSSGAHFNVSAGGSALFSSRESLGRDRPDIAIPLPAGLLEENARGAIELAITSTGDYGSTSYLLFPVVPPPWGRPARRDGSAALSPATGLRSGSLDWWAHAGSD